MMTTAKKSRMWKDGARRGIVYVEEREAAEKVMALQSGWAAAAAPAPLPGRASQQQRRRTASLASNTVGKTVSPVSHAEAELKGCAAMAVYLDRKGKPFAWQIPFAIEHWDRVTRLVGAEAATA